MGQEFHVIRCYTCLTFQTHIVKKIKKWECKMCGEKQSLKKIYGQGTGKDCRLHTQKLNKLRLKNEEMLYHTQPDDETQAEYSLSGNNQDENSMESDCSTKLTRKYETNYVTNPVKKIKLNPATNNKMLPATTLKWNMFENTGSASLCYNRKLPSCNETNLKTWKDNKLNNSKWGKYLEETKQLHSNIYDQDKGEPPGINEINNKYTQGKTTSIECNGESQLGEESHKYLICNEKTFDNYNGNESNENKWCSSIEHTNLTNNLIINKDTKHVEKLIDSDQDKLENIENNKQDNIKSIFEQYEDDVDFEIDL